jgi:hypothetical protein
VQQLIAARAGIKAVDWDGYMKYWKPSERAVLGRQKEVSEELLALASIEDTPEQQQQRGAKAGAEDDTQLAPLTTGASGYGTGPGSAFRSLSTGSGTAAAGQSATVATAGLATAPGADGVRRRAAREEGESSSSSSSSAPALASVSAPFPRTREGDAAPATASATATRRASASGPDGAADGASVSSGQSQGTPFAGVSAGADGLVSFEDHDDSAQGEELQQKQALAAAAAVAAQRKAVLRQASRSSMHSGLPSPLLVAGQPLATVTISPMAGGALSPTMADLPSSMRGLMSALSAKQLQTAEATASVSSAATGPSSHRTNPSSDFEIGDD